MTVSLILYELILVSENSHNLSLSFVWSEVKFLCLSEDGDIQAEIKFTTDQKTMKLFQEDLEDGFVYHEDKTTKV